VWRKTSQRGSLSAAAQTHRSSLHILRFSLALCIPHSHSPPINSPLDSLQRIPLQAIRVNDFLAQGRRSEVSDSRPGDRSGGLDGGVGAVFVADRVSRSARRREGGHELVGRGRRARLRGLVLRSGGGVGRLGVVGGALGSGRSGLRRLETGEREAVKLQSQPASSGRREQRSHLEGR
jgi:hypothetical protein